MGELTPACPWTVKESSCLQGCDDRQGEQGLCGWREMPEAPSASQGKPSGQGSHLPRPAQLPGGLKAKCPVLAPSRLP